MFRLDRSWLQCPCDLCVHNHADGSLGTQLYAMKTCKFCTKSIHENGYTACFTPIVKGTDSFIMLVFCGYFELNIDMLEKVVYNKLGFSLSWGTVGRIDQDGNVAHVYDPLWVVMNSLNLVLKTNKAFRSKYNKMPALLQKLYPAYCKGTDEEKCLMAASVWYSVETKQLVMGLSAKVLEVLQNSHTADEFSQIKIRGLLNLLGHPLFTEENVNSKNSEIQEKLNAVIERVNETTRKIATEGNMYVQTL